MAKTTGGDPTEPMRARASEYAGVAEGTACTQSSFRTATSAFLFVGRQGGRYKAMFKLGKSRVEAQRLAAERPDDYQVGSSVWVTARFTAEQPMPRVRWMKWLDESYELSLGATMKGMARRPAKTKAGSKALKKKGTRTRNPNP